jgi:cation:H+ antiporter
MRRRPPPEIAEAKAIEREMAVTRWAWLETPTGTGVQFMLGATLVALGSKLLVDGAVGAAARLGIPSMVVGLTVVALGTSLPELTTAVTSSRRAVSDLAVGNVLGANIANLTLVVGTAAVVQDARMERLTQLFNFPAMLFVMLLLVVMMWSGGALDKRDGWILIGVYLTYLAVVAGLALAAS